MAHRNWKWEKKVIYPLAKDAQVCKKDVSTGHQYKNRKHLEHDRMQCETDVTNTWDSIFKLKLL